MAGIKSVKTLRAIIESEGVEVVGAKITDHVKFELSYKGQEFIYVTGQNDLMRDRRKMMTFRGDIRRAKKAIDTGDETLMKKYLGVHE